MRLSRARGALLLGAALASVGLSLFLGPRIAGVVEAGTGWLRGLGAWGWALFMAVEFAVTLVGIVPGALLGIAGGAIYGVVTGFCASAAGIMAGAMVAFALSRSVMRPWIGALLRRSGRVAALDEMIARDGWRIVALLRISPVMPFSITSYALGFTGIAARDYVLGTLASLPPLLGYVVIGALGGVELKTGTRVHLVLIGVGVAATLALTVHLSRLVGRALRAA
jgi:uncharacterized membrane protein YdjX (TVP38/TMEM64 family)